MCTAHHVIVFVDQSYSGELAMQAAQSTNERLDNVMIIPTTRTNDWTPRHSFSVNMRESSRTTCLSEYIKVSSF